MYLFNFDSDSRVLVFQIVESESERLAVVQVKHLGVRHRLQLDPPQLRASQDGRRTLLHRGWGLRQRRTRKRDPVARKNLEHSQFTHLSSEHKSWEFFLLGFGLSRLTSLQFIQYHVAGFYKPCILHSPPSHLRDYSKRNNARLEFSTIFVPSFDPNEWCLQNVLRNEFLNPGPLGHESSALTTRPRLLATKIMRNFNLLIFQVSINHEKFQLTHLSKNMEQIKPNYCNRNTNFQFMVMKWKTRMDSFWLICLQPQVENRFLRRIKGLSLDNGTSALYLLTNPDG